MQADAGEARAVEMLEHRQLDENNPIESAPQLETLQGYRDAGNQDFDMRQRQDAAALDAFDLDVELDARRAPHSSRAAGALPPSIISKDRRGNAPCDGGMLP